MQEYLDGLSIEGEEAVHLNKIKMFLKSLDVDKIPSDFKVCPYCRGTGLHNVIYGEYSDLTYWNGLYCKTCKGTGYTHFDESIIQICPLCNGSEQKRSKCEACKGLGYVDWVTLVKINFGVLE